MTISYGDEVTFGDNVPCFNLGCRHHRRHPCGMCGRIDCRGVATVRSGFLTVKWEREEHDEDDSESRAAGRTSCG